MFQFAGAFGFSSFLFTLTFFLVAAIIIVVLVKVIGQNSKNNRSPRLTVDATIVAKRTHTHHAGEHHATTYYVTFQVNSGDRMELRVSGQEYGLLAEGDRGALSFQGTRFLGFERT